jgi:hypothetical protein
LPALDVAWRESMKNIGFILLLVCFSNSVFAFGWEKIVDCGNGAVVIDTSKNSDNSADYQLVIRDKKAIDQLVIAGALDVTMVNQHGEFILGLTADQRNAFWGQVLLRRTDFFKYELKLFKEAGHLLIVVFLVQNGGTDFTKVAHQFFYPCKTKMPAYGPLFDFEN